MAWYNPGIIGAIVDPLYEAGVNAVGGRTSKQKRLAGEARAKNKKDKTLFGENIAANTEADKRMEKLAGDMKTKMADVPGAAHRDTAEANALAMARANMAGPGSIGAFRQSGVKGHDVLASNRADLSTALLATERGQQADEQQSAIDVSNALEAARRSGALNQGSIARISAMARGDAAKRMVAHAEDTYKAPKKSSLSGDVGNIMGYLTT